MRIVDSPGSKFTLGVAFAENQLWSNPALAVVHIPDFQGDTLLNSTSRQHHRTQRAIWQG